MLDAVDAGVDQGRQRGLSEDVGRDPGVVLVGGRDRLADGVRVPARRQVTAVAGDPVADQLDPAVAALRLLDDVRRELVGLDLVGVAADVAPGAREVPAGPDQAGQVVALLHPTGVAGRSAVAQEQRTGVAVGDRLPLGLRVLDGAVRSETDVAVRVDQAGHDPARRPRTRLPPASRR